MSSGAAHPVETTSGRAPAGPASRAWPAPSAGLWAGVVLLALVYQALFFRWFQRQGLLSWDTARRLGARVRDPGDQRVLHLAQPRPILAQRPAAFWPGLAPLLLGVVSYFYAVVAIRNHMVEGLGGAAGVVRARRC
jgi:hypothetical protein